MKDSLETDDKEKFEIFWDYLINGKQDFYFAFFEKSAPYDWRSLLIDQERFESGLTDWHDALRQYRHCVVKYGTKPWIGKYGEEPMLISQLGK